MSEIAPVIGSLAQYDVTILVQAGIMLPLFDALSVTDTKVVEASARALKQMVQHPLSLEYAEIKVRILDLLSGITYQSLDFTLPTSSTSNFKDEFANL